MQPLTPRDIHEGIQFSIESNSSTSFREMQLSLLCRWKNPEHIHPERHQLWVEHVTNLKIQVSSCNAFHARRDF